MAKAISTEFDQNITEDVLLEQIEGQAPAVQTTLQNAENVYKSFLYLRKMYSGFPAKESIVGMATIDEAAYVTKIIPAFGNTIVVNNVGASTAGIKLNGNEYVIRIGENVTFPIVAPDTSSAPVIVGDTLELQGNSSYIIKNVQGF